MGWSEGTAGGDRVGEIHNWREVEMKRWRRRGCQGTA